MEFVNESGFPAQWTMAFDKGGREMLVVVVKGTFDLPTAGQPAERAESQCPLTKADEFEGDPGLSAPARETDFASFKPQCDILLAGSAHAPDGRPVRQLAVGLKVGSWTKAFQVTGPRRWSKGILGIAAGRPEPFVTMPFGYGTAFGGQDLPVRDDAPPRAYEPNPVGLGFRPSKREMDGLPMPVTEELNRPVDDPSGIYRPMAFGPVGRNWHPRYCDAGTYDQVWLDHRAPYWPDDFDFRYFQSAPADQRTDYLQGGEGVVLHNLSAQGRSAFALPQVPLAILLVPHRGEPSRIRPVIDTLVLEPDELRFTLTWRLTHRLRRNCFELKQVVVGDITPTRRRELVSPNKEHYRSLDDLVRQRRGVP